MRDATKLCEICQAAPPHHGVGFPAWPGAVPGLPDHLRGLCLWVCAAPRCDLGAQIRAQKAARAVGVTLTKIARVTRFPSP